MTRPTASAAPTVPAVIHARTALDHLRAALVSAKAAGSLRTVARIRAAITSAGGAVRHAEAHRDRSLPVESAPAALPSMAATPELRPGDRVTGPWGAGTISAPDPEAAMHLLAHSPGFRFVVWDDGSPTWCQADSLQRFGESPASADAGR